MQIFAGAHRSRGGVKVQWGRGRRQISAFFGGYFLVATSSETFEIKLALLYGDSQLPACNIDCKVNHAA